MGLSPQIGLAYWKMLAHIVVQILTFGTDPFLSLQVISLLGPPRPILICNFKSGLEASRQLTSRAFVLMIAAKDIFSWGVEVSLLLQGSC